MKFTSQVYAATSGSVGGLTYSRNKGGMYCRARAVPTDPNTAFQQTVRNIMSQLAVAWTALTVAQRNAWAVWATNMSFVNSLGATFLYTPQNCFNFCNIARVQASLSVITAAPVIFDLATLTPPVPTITAAGTTVSVAYTNTDAWANEVGGALLVYASRPQSPTINFFKSPYRFAGKVAGAGTPPTSPAVITLPFTSGPTGSKQFFRFRAVRADGRPSPDFRVGATV